jgi:SAM-dependent methyltransferase
VDGDCADVDPVSLNRAYWDALAAVHGRGVDRYYDLDGLLAGGSSMLDVEEAAVREAVGEVDGLDLLHVQCHIGFDTVTLARRGARVTGVDLSPISLERTGAIARQCGVQVGLVEADATRLPVDLHDRFDLAYATIGVICWIGDLQAWMRSVAACLRPGGSLVLVDIHPLYQMVEGVSPVTFDWPYAFDGPHVEDAQGSYAAPDARLAASVSVAYAHSLGEVVTAACRARLTVRSLHEHLDAQADPRGELLTRGGDGRYRLMLGSHPGPVMFTLIARR